MKKSMLTFKKIIQNNTVSVVNTHLISHIPEIASMASKNPFLEGLQTRHFLIMNFLRKKCFVPPVFVFTIIRCFCYPLCDNEYMYLDCMKNRSVIYVQITDRLDKKITLLLCIVKLGIIVGSTLIFCEFTTHMNYDRIQIFFSSNLFIRNLLNQKNCSEKFQINIHVDLGINHSTIRVV